jgi:glycosyltransferase involved in cell wall biosynthesis
MPLISVIIPVYNGAKTIKETIESVLQQTLTDFELIVINSDSIDGTLEIVNSIQDSRLKVFTYPQANVGINRNRGIDNATGELITFLDADDLWTADKLEAQYKALQENPQAAVAYSWTDHIDENGKYVGICSHVNWTGDVYPPMLLTNFIVTGSNVLIHSQALKEVGRFDESLTNAHDTDMWLRLAARYQFVLVPRVQIFYRISTNSLSSNVWRLETACLKVLESAFQAAPESLQYLKPHCFANLYKYLLYKALLGESDRTKSRIAAKFLAKTIKYDPSLLRKGVSFKSLLKILVIALLPSKWSSELFKKMPRLANTTTLLSYLQTDPVFIN